MGKLSEREESEADGGRERKRSTDVQPCTAPFVSSQSQVFRQGQLEQGATLW